MTDVQSETGPVPRPAEAGEPGEQQPLLLGEHERELAARAARAAARGAKPTRIVAARVSVWKRIPELWRSRELFVFLVRKEIKVKYKNSVLGFMWSMLNPALTLAVFYVLFTFFLPNGIPNFVIYMFSAMLVWNLFQTAVLTGTSSVVANGGIVKKVAFPREILALSSVGSAFMFFLFQSIVLLVFMVAFWHRPDWSAIWLIIPALAAVLAFAAALAVFLSAVNVYLRDTQHLVEVALMAWFWAVPGIYPFSGRVHDGLVRKHIIWVYFLNPVTPVVMTFQRVFYNVLHPISTTLTQKLASGTVVHLPVPNGVLASYGTLWYVGADLAVLAISVVLLFGALVVFGRLEGNFAEEL
ncbi:MAG TPA: ABC transporter permease [Acidimicrobiales bacterium]|nr:ABC transporter permease [Acidimicrobiales bacterium]